MKQYIAHITLLVSDYDEAIQFYTEKLMGKSKEITLAIKLVAGFRYFCIPMIFGGIMPICRLKTLNLFVSLKQNYMAL